ncbi:hypothetical protein [Thermincola ferriacetica]
MFSGAGLWLNPPVFHGGMGGVLRLPLRSDCARKSADKKAGGSRMFEDGEGRCTAKTCRWGGKTISCDLVKGEQTVLTIVKA